MAPGQEQQICMLCKTQQVLGHLDPDNLQWYCENCWQSFSGNSRTCFRCREFSAKGSVDSRDKRWYCSKCWNFYTNDGNNPNNPTAPGQQAGKGTTTAPPGMPPMPQISRMPGLQHQSNTTTGGMNNAPSPNATPGMAMNGGGMPGMPNGMAPPMANNMPGMNPMMMNPMQGMPGMNPMQGMPGMGGNMGGMGGMPGMNNPMMQGNMGMPGGMPNGMGPMNGMNPMMQGNMGMQNMGGGMMMNPAMMMGQKGMNPQVPQAPSNKGTGKGKPKINIRPAVGAPSTTQGVDTGAKRFVGKIKGFNPKQGYGFLTCDEVKNIYGRDIFMHHAQLTQVIGKDALTELPDHVSAETFVNIHVEFSVAINDKGMPQARDCYLQGKTPDGIKSKSMQNVDLTPSKPNILDSELEPGTKRLKLEESLTATISEDNDLEKNLADLEAMKKQHEEMQRHQLERIKEMQSQQQAANLLKQEERLEAMLQAKMAEKAKADALVQQKQDDQLEEEDAQLERAREVLLRERQEEFEAENRLQEARENSVGSN